jgi:uncharacterized protein YcfL
MKKYIIVILFLLVLSGCGPSTEIYLEEGQDTIEVGDSYIAKRCFISIDGQEQRMTVVSNPVDVDVVGTYIVEYEYDLDGDIYECQRYVFVTDQTSPSVSLNPGVDTIILGQDWVDASVTATDNYDTDLDIETIIPDGLGDTVGSFYVEYMVTDTSGNQTSIRRAVHVIEGE